MTLLDEAAYLPRGGGLFESGACLYCALRQAAAAMIQQLRQTMEMLRRFPQAGQVLEASPSVRRFSATPYLIDYEVVEGVLGVLTIRHARQRDPDVMQDQTGDFEDI